jgi:hypothetical protein
MKRVCVCVCVRFGRGYSIAPTAKHEILFLLVHRDLVLQLLSVDGALFNVLLQRRNSPLPSLSRLHRRSPIPMFLLAAHQPLSLSSHEIWWKPFVFGLTTLPGYSIFHRVTLAYPLEYTLNKLK